MRFLKGQGATEYLVLLAIVLIVALVSVALLGFFPGMASDAQQTQSKTYWSSASPIAITEWGAMAYGAGSTATMPYLRLKNNGMHPIRITKLLGGGEGRNVSIVYVEAAIYNISDLYYLAPGEEKYIADRNNSGVSHWAVPEQRYISFRLSSEGFPGTYNFRAASSVCSLSPPYGTLVVKDFGFEYIVYIEGQQVTKRQVGKDLIIRCSQLPG